jgi:3-phenylpropionate/trans-cinnamate dioxygenase ferredoxin reductase subunit
MTNNKDRTFVVVGASLAGAMAVQTLREEGFDGRVVLIGDEPYPPYERPPLSKDYLRGETPRERLHIHPRTFYADNGIELLTATAVREVDAPASEVVLDAGQRLRYDRLLLATGVAPRRLDVPGAKLDGVYYLRAVEDSNAIAEHLERGGKVVVVGGGWIGSEVAASARQKGLEVTVIMEEDVPLVRQLGLEVGAVYRDLHRERGVEFVTASVAAFEGEGPVRRVRTRDGRAVEADFVVVAVGAEPRTDLARRARVAVDGAIRTDEYLRTSVPNVFAAGDVANAYHPFYGRRLRVEHWDNARGQGAAAAINMLGRGVPYGRVPYFFSDQYDVGVEFRGDATEADRVVFRGHPDARNFYAFWLNWEDRVVAGANVHTHEHGHAHGEHDDHDAHGRAHGHGDHDCAPAGDVGAVEALLRSRSKADARRLTDVDEDLDGLVRDARRAA